MQFNPDKDKIIALDFTNANKALEKIDIANTEMFCRYIDEVLQKADAKFGAGGYNELRNMYASSDLFNKNQDDEARRLHIGFDIWGKAGTEVFAPCNAIVHSFAFNNHFGDYGATIILKHDIDDIAFYTFYGHLSINDLKGLNEGAEIQSGKVFAHFGLPDENGNWPPHLHFQIINDIENYKGDYPGVCKESEGKKYMENCPDPDLILNIKKFITV